jgi:CHAT domain-containing protein
MDVCAEIHWKRTVGGFQPWKNISEIKGGKKDIGVKNLKLFVPRGGVEVSSYAVEVQDNIFSADSRIKKAREAEVNTEKAENLLRKARDAYLMNEWKDAKPSVEEAENELTSQIEELKSRVTAVKKYPNIDFPDHVILGKRRSLVVQLLPDKLEDFLELTFGYPKGVEEIEITVALDARDFEIEKAVQKMQVPLRKNSESIVFHLTPKSVGEKEIRLKFYQDKSYNGEVFIKTTVVKDEKSEEAIQKAMPQGRPGLSLVGGEREDLVLEVKRVYDPHDQSDHLEYSVTSKILGVDSKKWSTKESLHDPLQRINTMFEQLSAISSAGYSDEKLYRNIISEIETIGKNLYITLIPDELKDALWEKKDRIHSIRVITNEEWIPWEIIKPYRITNEGNTETDDFWCMRYVISRWFPGDYAYEIIFVKTSAVMAYGGNDKLKYVIKEGKIFKEIVGNKGIDIISIKPRRLELLDSLSDKEINLFHFACDITYDDHNPDDSYISLLEDYKLKEKDIKVQNKLKAQDIKVQNLRKGKPLILINACQSGRTGYAFSGIGGFAKAFLDAGAYAFIGPMWKVPDKYALEFSKFFYKNLFEENLSIGEALKKTRADLKKELRNPIWLAYSHYGFPLAKVTI